MRSAANAPTRTIAVTCARNVYIFSLPSAASVASVMNRGLLLSFLLVLRPGRTGSLEILPIARMKRMDLSISRFQSLHPLFHLLYQRPSLPLRSPNLRPVDPVGKKGSFGTGHTPLRILVRWHSVGKPHLHFPDHVMKTSQSRVFFTRNQGHSV